MDKRLVQIFFVFTLTLSQIALTQNPDDFLANPEDPWVTDPADPFATDPADLWGTDPADPFATDPADPFSTNPTDPFATDPTMPGTPVDPEDDQWDLGNEEWNSEEWQFDGVTTLDNANAAAEAVIAASASISNLATNLQSNPAITADPTLNEAANNLTASSTALNDAGNQIKIAATESLDTESGVLVDAGFNAKAVFWAAFKNIFSILKGTVNLDPSAKIQVAASVLNVIPDLDNAQASLDQTFGPSIAQPDPDTATGTNETTPELINAATDALGAASSAVTNAATGLNNAAAAVGDSTINSALVSAANSLTGSATSLDDASNQITTASSQSLDTSTGALAEAGNTTKNAYQQTITALGEALSALSTIPNDNGQRIDPLIGSLEAALTLADAEQPLVNVWRNLTFSY